MQIANPINIVTYASLKDKIGHQWTFCPQKNNYTAQEILQVAAENFPEHQAVLLKSKIATRNQVFLNHENIQIENHTELFLLPPFTGG